MVHRSSITILQDPVFLALRADNRWLVHQVSAHPPRLKTRSPISTRCRIRFFFRLAVGSSSPGGHQGRALASIFRKSGHESRHRSKFTTVARGSSPDFAASRQQPQARDTPAPVARFRGSAPYKKKPRVSLLEKLQELLYRAWGCASPPIRYRNHDPAIQGDGAQLGQRSYSWPRPPLPVRGAESAVAS